MEVERLRQVDHHVSHVFWGFATPQPRLMQMAFAVDVALCRSLNGIDISGDWRLLGSDNYPRLIWLGNPLLWDR
jgi:hypothetical protein